MKRGVTIAIFFIVAVMFCSRLFCENMLLLDSQVPDKPYFMIGDIIYKARLESQNSLDGSYQVYYRYIGFSGKRVSIRSEYVADDDSHKPHVPPQSTTIVVAFDKEEKGHVLVPALPKRPHEVKVLPLELVIGIYDRQKQLITVSEYGKQHISQRRGSITYEKPGSRSSSQEQGGYGK